MKKNLLSIGALVLSLGVSAQSAQGLYVDNGATVYVSPQTLLYNGGSIGTKGSGTIENHGNVSVVALSSDDRIAVENNNGQDHYPIHNVIISPSDIGNRSLFGYNWKSYQYGQLKINGFQQRNLVPVNQDFLAEYHGQWEQLAIPFSDLTIAQLRKDLSFASNLIYNWENRRVYFKSLTDNNTSVSPTENQDELIKGKPSVSSYFLLQNGEYAYDTPKQIKGKPFVSVGQEYNVPLYNAGKGIKFGENGEEINPEGKTYRSYLSDFASISEGKDNYGRNLYQYGNPFLMNLDMSKIKEQTQVFNHIKAIRLESTSATNSKTGKTGTPAQAKIVTILKDGGQFVFVGDVNYLVVRPFGTFVIKMDKDTPDGTQLDLNKLRTFDYEAKYKSEARNSKTVIKRSVSSTDESSFRSSDPSSLKQLGVIGLNAKGEEVARTYYVVSPYAVSGPSQEAKLQATTHSPKLVTFEEDAKKGGYAEDAKDYMLYINEANQNEIAGKKIKLVKYADDIVKFRFEMLEDALPVDDNKTVGDGFYIQNSDNSQPIEIKNNTQISVAQGKAQEFNLYYGNPKPFNEGVFKDKTTVVAYNKAIGNYIIKFDPSWKKANLSIYDMSGRMVQSESNINAANNYTIKLDSQSKGVYVVKVVSEKGDEYQTKIIK